VATSRECRTELELPTSLANKTRAKAGQLALPRILRLFLVLRLALKAAFGFKVPFYIFIGALKIMSDR
jgi:hypothetical protein